MNRKLGFLLLVVLANQALFAQRSTFQWASMVTIGNDFARVNQAVTFLHYPPLSCLTQLNEERGKTCNTASDQGMVTASFDSRSLLFNLEEASKDPDRTNYRLFRTALALQLGAPKVDPNNRTRMTWHQPDGSRVMLQWFNGIYILTLKAKTEPVN